MLEKFKEVFTGDVLESLDSIDKVDELTLRSFSAAVK